MTKRETRSRPSHEPEQVTLGFGDLHASSGDHIAHFYQSEDERWSVLIPFLKSGLDAGEKCICLARRGPATETLREAMHAAEIDVDQVCASGRLVIDDGKTSPQEMQAFLHAVLADMSGRFPLLRWGADMTWSLRKLASSHALMEWETYCNTIDAVPAVFLCQYDLKEFMGSVVLDAFKTHPMCIVSNVIHQNPYFVEPNLFLDELQNRDAVAGNGEHHP